MKTKTTTVILAALTFAAFSFSSCKKEETLVKGPNNTTNTTNKEVTSARIVANNVTYMHLSTFLQDLARQSRIVKKMDDNSLGCANVTIDSSAAPSYTATFDFGGGCYDSAGVYYAGNLVIQFENLGTNGGTLNATFTNVVIDTLTFDGTFSFTNTGTNGLGRPTGSISINMTTGYTRDNMKLTGTQTMNYEWVSARNIAQVSVTGSGADQYGTQFSQSTNAALGLIDEDVCREHFTSGELYIEYPSSPGDEETINYGTGNCDNQAELTKNGITTTIILQ